MIDFARELGVQRVSRHLLCVLALGSSSLACGDSATPGAGSEESGTEDSGTETSGSESTTDECIVGAEGCACTPGGGCDPGLMCEGDMCVPASSGDGDGDTSGDGDGDTSGDGDGDTSGDGDGDTSGDGDGDPVPPPPNCGDGQVDLDEGEQCDDGNMVPGDGCDDLCQVEVGMACGDGELNPDNGEECDDGNLVADDGCSPNCQLEPLGELCGDDNIDNLEICDDGGTQNGDACNPTCNLENTTSLFVGSPGVAGLIDGVGQNARLGGWCVLAADNSYLWVGDTLGQGHAVVRRVDVQTSEVLTIAGGPQGDTDAPNGINARFQWIEALTTDGNTLWVADGGNHKIKAIDLQPPYAVTTVAGSGQNAVVDGNGVNAAFGDIRAVTYYAGLVYQLDGANAVLRSFDPQSGDVLTIAGMPGQQGQTDGIGGQARFISPRYMASDNSGMLYIADTNGNKLRSYNTVDGFVGTFAGDGSVGYVDDIGQAARIHRPRGMSSDGTSIYFSEFNQHTVRQGVLATQSISTNVGQDCGGGGGNCNGGYQEGTGTANTQLRNPVGLAFHFPTNTLFICDGGNNVIRAMR